MKPLSACMESMRQKSNVVSADAPEGISKVPSDGPMNRIYIHINVVVAESKSMRA